MISDSNLFKELIPLRYMEGKDEIDITLDVAKTYLIKARMNHNKKEAITQIEKAVSVLNALLEKIK